MLHKQLVMIAYLTVWLSLSHRSRLYPFDVGVFFTVLFISKSWNLQLKYPQNCAILPPKCKKKFWGGDPSLHPSTRAAPRQVISCWQPRRTGRIACSVISSWIDYCNSLLYGAPAAVVDKLQRAQNNVARVICQQRRCVHARPLLQSLHWLPVQQRIQYKIAVITHKALSTSVPPYIDELLQHQYWRRGLCGSTDAPRLSVPWTRTETAKRAFCMAPPNVWNGIVDFVTPVAVNLQCQTENTLYCCVGLLVMNIPTFTPLYWLIVNIIGAIQIIYL